MCDQKTRAVRDRGPARSRALAGRDATTRRPRAKESFRVRPCGRERCERAASGRRARVATELAEYAGRPPSRAARRPRARGTATTGRSTSAPAHAIAACHCSGIHPHSSSTSARQWPSSAASTACGPASAVIPLDPTAKRRRARRIEKGGKAANDGDRSPRRFIRTLAERGHRCARTRTRDRRSASSRLPGECRRRARRPRAPAGRDLPA